MRGARAVVSAATVLLATLHSVHALASWSVAGNSRVSSGYDDNLRFTLTNPVSTASTSAVLGAQIAKRSDRYSVDISPRATISRYSDYSLFDRTDRFLGVRAAVLGERHRNDFALNATRDTTLTSEYGLTGIVDVNLPHEATDMSVGHTLYHTERLVHEFQAFGSGHRYRDTELTGLRDYDYVGARYNATFLLNERIRLFLEASASELDVDGAGAFSSDNVALMTGVTTSLAERWTVSASYGPSRRHTPFAEVTGAVYAFSADWQVERAQWGLTIRRDLSPTSRGLLNERETARLSFDRSMTERLSVVTSAVWTRSRDVLPRFDFEFNEFRFADVNAELRWAISETWSVSGSIAAARQNYVDWGSPAERKRVVVSVNWAGRRRELQ